MNEQFETIYHTLEDENWWFRSRRDFVARTLRRYGIDTGGTVLDIGCGGGGLLQFLGGKGYANTYGIDISAQGIAHCTKRGLTNVQIADAEAPLPFKENFFDLIVASDVIEHLDRPEAAVAHWRSLLKDSGMLLIFVPAFRMLWSHHDVLNHHRRRYTQRMVRKLMHEAGFHWVRGSYWNAFLFIPYVCILKLKSVIGKRAMVMRKNSSVLNELLYLILLLENILIFAGVRFPVGVSYVALVRK